MTNRRRRRRNVKSEPQELPPTTDNLEAQDELKTSVDILADPEATTWEESPGREITAPVELPSQEAMTVRLGPVNLIERLDEYHSDENLAHTLIGLFVGAILGIIADWFIKIPIQVTPFSVILIVILFLLTVSTIFWLIRIRKRRNNIQRQIIIH